MPSVRHYRPAGGSEGEVQEVVRLKQMIAAISGRKAQGLSAPEIK